MDAEAEEDIRKIVNRIDRRINGTEPERDIYPTDEALVITGDEQGLLLTSKNWGYPGIQGKGVIFNARAESVMEKKLFSEGIHHHRAIIPAKHFYEWNKNKEKNTFTRKDADVLYMAGFYDLFDGKERFVILTTDANESMKPVHDRMPLILEKDQLKDWIQEENQVKEFLKQTPVLLDRKVEYEQMTLL